MKFAKMLFNVVNYQYLPWFAVKCRYILEARELPILSMVDRIYRQLMTRHYNKQLESDKWQGDVCPKIRKKVEKVTEFANTCYVEGSGDGLFLVGDRGVDYIVDMHKRACTCKRIKKKGFHVLMSLPAAGMIELILLPWLTLATQRRCSKRHMETLYILAKIGESGRTCVGPQSCHHCTRSM